MPFIALAGTPYDVLAPGASQAQSEAVGEAVRAIDGTLRSGVTRKKRSFRFTLEPMTQAAFETLEALERSGDFVAVTGDAMGAAAGDYELTITESGYTRKGSTSFRRAVQIALREV